MSIPPLAKDRAGKRRGLREDPRERSEGVTNLDVLTSVSGGAANVKSSAQQQQQSRRR